MSIAQQFADLSFAVNASFVADFLKFCLKDKEFKKVEKVMEDFEELYTEYLEKDGPTIEIDKIIHAKISSIKAKSPRKTKFSTEHKGDGFCNHIFKNGKHINEYCNSKVFAGDDEVDCDNEHCKTHIPTDKKDKQDKKECRAKTTKGEKCSKNATKEFKGKHYCVVHFKKLNEVPVEKKKSESDSENTEKKETVKETVKEKMCKFIQNELTIGRSDNDLTPYNKKRLAEFFSNNDNRIDNIVKKLIKNCKKDGDDVLKAENDWFTELIYEEFSHEINE